jgi:hypothetical protein
LWWACITAVIYGAAFLFLMHMVPPPRPTLSSNEIAAFYTEHHDSIRIGAVIASWTSAFMLPLAMVIAAQMRRQEEGRIWTYMTITGGAMMSIFLVLPPLFWGVAAYTPTRSPEVTSLMHELGVLTLTTTDQFYIFMWVAIVVVCFIPTTVRHSPFTRTYGYFTAWSAFMFEAGAFAFLPRTGPFSWRGLLVFWSPLTIFSVWIAVTAFVLGRALKAQRADARQAQVAGPPATAVPAPA